jgi:hypothetical protein
VRVLPVPGAEDAPLESPARGQQALGVASEHDGMPLHAVEQARWQHNVIALDPRQMVELDEGLRPHAHLARGQGDHVSAVDVQAAGG